MNLNDILRRELVGLDILMQRMELVKALVDGLQHDPAWLGAGDLDRRKAAKRMAFTMHRLNVLNGWNDTLRNRRWGR